MRSFPLSLLLMVFFVSNAVAQAARQELLQHNRSFLERHELRLERDLERLQATSPVEAPEWMSSVRTQLRSEKRSALALVRRAKALPDPKLGTRPFRNLYDALRMLGLLEPQEGDTASRAFGGWGSSIISKKSLGGAPGFAAREPREWEPRGERDLSRLPELDLDRMRLDLGRLRRETAVTAAQPIATADFLNPKKYPAHAAFLRKIGLTDTKALASLPASVDLSGIYSTAPRWQGATFACTAAALIDSIEAQTGTRFSVDQAYGQLAAAELLDVLPSALPENYDDQLNGDGDGASEATRDAAFTPVRLENYFDFLNSGVLVTAEDQAKGPVFRASRRYAGRKAQLTGFARLDLEKHPGVSAGLLKWILSSRKSPIVLIDSDARTQEEDWMRISPMGSVQHVMSLVGYGVEESPYTLKPTAYFLVRDPLVRSGRHVKIPADNLLSHLTGIIQPARVKEL